MAQNYTLGQVAIIHKGAYSSSTSYAPLNTVTHRGGSFMCITACTNIEPGVHASWQTYWVPTAIGILSAEVTSPSDTTATMTLTFSDGTTYSHTYGTTGVADGSVKNVSIGEAVAIAKGGTGATSAAAARTNLGAQATLIEFQINLTGGASAWTFSTDASGVSLAGRVLSTSKVMVAPEPTLANAQNYGNYFVLLQTVEAGRLYFTTRDTIPSGTTITVNVLVAN